MTAAAHGRAYETDSFAEITDEQERAFHLAEELPK
jgi:hypothetical protein